MSHLVTGLQQALMMHCNACSFSSNCVFFQQQIRLTLARPAGTDPIDYSTTLMCLGPENFGVSDPCKTTCMSHRASAPTANTIRGQTAHILYVKLGEVDGCIETYHLVDQVKA